MNIVNMNLAIWLCSALVLLMILDVITGYIHAIITGTVQSSRMRQGFWKKGAELAYVTVASALDMLTRWLLKDGDIPEAISSALIPLTIVGATGYLIVMEATSIFENMKAITGYDPTEE